jgi:hypothetical protein
MKFNKWTLSLAALGVVSLASAVRADEKAAPIYLETAVSGTSISGYVNTSAQWNVGNNGQAPGYGYGQADNYGKADGFNIDAVEVTISKSLDDSQWASGYNATLVTGQDAGSVGRGIGTQSVTSSENFGSFGASIKDAYAELRAPVGNGLDIKAGVFDTLLGYEVFDAGSDPNYTRSYGYSIEPTTHTGVLLAYNFFDWLSVQAGVGNTTLNANPGYDRNGTGYFTTGTTIESKKAYYGSVALTAPNSWGFLAGSTLYFAVEGGRPGGQSFTTTGISYDDQVNYYAGAVINTPVKGLKFGAAYDYVGYKAASGSISTGTTANSAWADALAAYVSYQATDKLSFNGRAEYAWESASMASTPTGSWYTPTTPNGATEAVYALTGTVEYDLWKNVMSRVEVRWDSVKDDSFGSTGGKKDAVLLAANLIYKF